MKKIIGARSLYHSISEQIYQTRMDIYTTGEAQQIALMLIEHFLGQQRNDIIIDRQIQIDVKQESMLSSAVDRILRYEPIQYIIGETYFYGRAFYVTPAVLIPRRETEELTDLVIKEYNGRQEKIKVLDLGTGSGCIAITLQKELTSARVSAIDNSQEALAVAKANAQRHNANVKWILQDILQYQFSKEDTFDVVVSNPPYVRESEAIEMRKNVLNYEPSSALFVSNKEPLIFYERIICLCTQEGLLRNNGKLFFEINESFGKAMVALLQQYGFSNVLLQKDMQGKDRFVSAKLIF